MKCINHYDTDAVGACVRCGKGLCIDCKRELGGKIHCQACADVPPTASVAKANNRKTIGATLIGIGATGLIISLVILILGFLHLPEPESLGYAFIGGPGIYVSFIILAIGIRIKTISVPIISVPAIPQFALVCSILGFICASASRSMRYLALVPAVILIATTIVLGTISLTKLKNNLLPSGRRTAKASLVLGILAPIIFSIWYLVIE